VSEDLWRTVGLSLSVSLNSSRNHKRQCNRPTH